MCALFHKLKCQNWVAQIRYSVNLFSTSSNVLCCFNTKHLLNCRMKVFGKIFILFSWVIVNFLIHTITEASFAPCNAESS